MEWRYRLQYKYSWAPSWPRGTVRAVRAVLGNETIHWHMMRSKLVGNWFCGVTGQRCSFIVGLVSGHTLGEFAACRGA